MRQSETITGIVAASRGTAAWRVGAGAMIALAMLLLWPSPASAACHIAAFEESEYRVDEDAGEIMITVFLVGRQPNCEGSVRFETADDSATAPTDYTERSGELTFESGDDREETITIPIGDDQEAEGNEQFTVRLLPVENSGIDPSPGDDTRSVVIADNDEAPAEDPTPETEPTPEETDDDMLGAAPTADEDSGVGAGVIVAIAAVLVALAGAMAWALRRRATG